MTYRILVDENTSPRVAESLREVGQEAVHVREVLGAGASDPEIRAYAVENDCVVCTHGIDFLHPEYYRSVPVLYYSDDTLDTSGIVQRIETVLEHVPNAQDLPPVTNLGSWE